MISANDADLVHRAEAILADVHAKQADRKRVAMALKVAAVADRVGMLLSCCVVASFVAGCLVPGVVPATVFIVLSLSACAACVVRIAFDIHARVVQARVQQRLPFLEARLRLEQLLH